LSQYIACKNCLSDEGLKKNIVEEVLLISPLTSLRAMLITEFLIAIQFKFNFFPEMEDLEDQRLSHASMVDREVLRIIQSGITSLADGACLCTLCGTVIKQRCNVKRHIRDKVSCQNAKENVRRLWF
jgi:hypothetical protein